MKVFLDYKLNDTGKGKFLKRLIDASDMKFSDKPKGCDVALGVSHWRTKTNLPKVLRLDGIRIGKEKKDFWYNKKLKKSIKESDQIIYQSEFAQNYITSRLKVKKGVVIHNGVSPKEFKVYKRKNYLSIILVGNWGYKKPRKHKRLKEMLNFLEWFLVKHKHYNVWVIGETKLQPRNSSIAMLGEIKENLNSYLSSAGVMLNLTTLDWCPNATVEALVAHVPVVCYEGTGVSELARLSGCNPLPRDAGYEGVEKAVLGCRGKVVNVPELYIENIEQQYRRVLKSVRR